MKYLFLLLSLLVLTVNSSFATDLQSKIEEFPKKEMKSQNKTIVKMFTSEMSKSLPQKIDKYTEFVKINAKDTTIFYTFEINTGSKSDATVRKEDKTRMHNAVQAGICKSSMKFLEAGINISYIYTSAISKANLFQFDVTQEDCIKIDN